MPVLYGLLPGLYNLLLGSDPLRERVAVLGIGAVYLGYFGAFFALLAALPYGVALYAWSLLSQSTALLEKNVLHVAAFTALLALPTAIIASIGAAEFAGSVRWGEAVRVLPLAFFVSWGALLIPRVAIRQLKPGAFLRRTPTAAV